MFNLSRKEAKYHGDQAVLSSSLNFAVNIRSNSPPDWLINKLSLRLNKIGNYPGKIDRLYVLEKLAIRHGCNVSEICLLNGSTEGFSLLSRLQPKLAALVAPSFTEPEAIFTESNIPIHHLILPIPFEMSSELMTPDLADLVVVGNPTNPTGVLHSRENILSLRRPGRLLIIDEAFSDMIMDQNEVLTSHFSSDILIFRSLTKIWSLAGLRIGYAIGPSYIIRHLNSLQSNWPISTLQLEAISISITPRALFEADVYAFYLKTMREIMEIVINEISSNMIKSIAPFILFKVKNIKAILTLLKNKDIAIRDCSTFIGLPEGYLRATVKPEWPILIDTIAENISV